MVVDNIRVPGAPAYRAHLRDNDGTLRSRLNTHMEYQSVIRDLVLESDYLGTQASSTGLPVEDLRVDPSSLTRPRLHRHARFSSAPHCAVRTACLLRSIPDEAGRCRSRQFRSSERQSLYFTRHYRR